MYTLTKEDVEWVKEVIRFLVQVRNWPLHLYEDLVQEALIALLKAAEKFDPSKGSFKSFCFRRVVGAARDLIRKEYGRRGITKKVPQTAIPLETLDAYDTLRYASYTIEKRLHARELLIKLYYHLSLREREILLKWLAYNDITWLTISLGCASPNSARSTVSHLRRKCRRKLKEWGYENT